ncbi:ribosome small subunit-dependent GTPase A [Selenomonas sp. F0473]|uniref:ribosome small subunit-dependent GTPase A n=1 Tax=Selenomonas sp. F0473 TaxID=999423 RepID=UPI00029EACEF|nr:ribosome small subunit-dependent GTPase A [Selenomonas sp. F0473]
MEQRGRVLKVYNSVIYAAADDGIVACKLRGRMKKGRNDRGIVPGDIVTFDRMDAEEGVVERIEERENLLVRPRVANLTQIIVTVAAAAPDPHPLVVSRFLVLAERSGAHKIVLCVNKIDLCSGDPKSIAADYACAGYPVLCVSAQTGAGVAALRDLLAGEITVFAGPSGTGKSSLLNTVDPALALATGTVSEKIGRGRHTTRRAELIPYAGGFVVDTPGFTQQELSDLTPEELTACFPEFARYTGCRFAPCSHSHEPDCAVKEAAEAGAISRARYEAYIALLSELRTKKK